MDETRRDEMRRGAMREQTNGRADGYTSRRAKSELRVPIEGGRKSRESDRDE